MRLVGIPYDRIIVCPMIRSSASLDFVYNLGLQKPTYTNFVLVNPATSRAFIDMCGPHLRESHKRPRATHR